MRKLKRLRQVTVGKQVVHVLTKVAETLTQVHYWKTCCTSLAKSYVTCMQQQVLHAENKL